MAQNVGTPRFYVNIYEYLNSLGLIAGSGGNLVQGGHINLNPTEKRLWTSSNGVNDTGTFITGTQINNFFGEKSFIALLGHNLFTAGGYVRVQGFENGASSANYDNTFSFSDLVNDSHQTGNTIYSEYDGFTISTFNGNSIGDDKNSISIRLDATGSSYAVDPYINSAFLGTYYDMPHSPDLNLKMSIEMDGIKSIQTKGGSTLSNATYTKPADWGEYGAWQLGDNQNYRSGRRVWDLSFSYLSDTDIMPNLGVQNYEEGAVTEDILTGTDFFSQVWNRTMGGHLPFIFQADGSATDPKPDQFAIARFDMKSLRLTQTMHRKYNVKLKIRETW